MWMVIHMTKSESAASEIRDALTGEGFLVKLRPVYRSLQAEENYYELLVLQSEAQEARQILLDRGLC